MHSSAAIAPHKYRQCGVEGCPAADAREPLSLDVEERLQGKRPALGRVEREELHAARLLHTAHEEEVRGPGAGDARWVQMSECVNR